MERWSDPLVARYWCHVCMRMINPALEAEITCPDCGEGFVEEMEMRSEAEDPSDHAFSLWAPILFNVVGASRHRAGDADLSAIMHRPRRRDAVSVLELLHGLRAVAADGDEEDGEQSVLTPDAARRGGISLGDYFVGSGFEALLQHLAENDANRYGSPPAEKAAIAALPTIRVARQRSCPVCLEDMEEGGEAKEMPCKHVFHEACLLPWLEMHSSCPVCRFELPAEEPRRGSYPGDGAGGGGGGGGGGASGERRLWPWPFSALYSNNEML